jgi:hypothetical protein
MSRHRRVALLVCWSCPLCGLATDPACGPSAADETAHLATVHDLVHHGGARTAQLCFVEGPAAWAVAS